MPSKVTLILQQSTRSSDDSPVPRTGSWTESFWHSSTDTNTVIEAVETGGISLLSARAGMLTAYGSIVGYRVQPYDLVANQLIPTGRSRPRRVGKQGIWDALPDIPQMAIQWTTGFTDHANRTVFKVAGVPDAQVVGGELVLAAGYVEALKAYRRRLAPAFGSVIIDRRTATKMKVVSITEAGLVTVNAISAELNIGLQVRITRSKDLVNTRHGGVYVVTAPLDRTARTFKIEGWPFGPSTGGRAVLNARVFAQFAQAELDIKRSSMRKVGAPFVRYRGRRKRRLK